VRIMPCDRVSVQRIVESVSTQWGFIPVKAAFIHGQLVSSCPCSTVLTVQYCVIVSTQWGFILVEAAFIHGQLVSSSVIVGQYCAVLLCGVVNSGQCTVLLSSIVLLYILYCQEVQCTVLHTASCK